MTEKHNSEREVSTTHETYQRLGHTPVMLDEAIRNLAPKAGGLYVDATFGAGGYTRAILESAACNVVALDRDPNAVRDGASIVYKFVTRLKLFQSRFSNLDNFLPKFEKSTVDGVVFDIGTSSMQLDQPQRGFSFQYDGPLDMRMSIDSEEHPSAADLLRDLSEKELANIIYHYGEERRSKAIASAIINMREATPLTRTGQLANICKRVYSHRYHGNLHPATRTFQALRIAVNDELRELFQGLCAAERILKPNGRLVVVTFHSLEDRIVKRFLNQRSRHNQGRSRHLPELIEVKRPSFRNVTNRPLTPSHQEVASNPRARSAKLRAATRTDEKAWEGQNEITPASKSSVVNHYG
ncbi:MAG: Ribosomal RNA small subunit methyltransferase H [Hyphomicrobiaceae bacterium hypho_1]